MNAYLSIKVKAGLLLLAFALNTTIGFACAIGVDMGFNSIHYDYDDSKIETEIHIHPNGQKHEHNKNSVDQHQDKSPAHHHDNKSKNNEQKEGCCNDSVVDFLQLDKSIPQSATALNPIFFAAIITVFHNSDIVYLPQVSGSSRYFARNYHPPIQDIRIAIQSFQI
jgi:hypothetical protein